MKIISIILMTFAALLFLISTVTLIIRVKQKKKCVPAIVTLSISVVLFFAGTLMLMLPYFSSAYLYVATLMEEKQQNYMEEKGKGIVAGWTWEADDASVLILGEDGLFQWYQAPENREDNYYAGSYHVYNGMDAVNYIVNELGEYDVTFDEQMELFERVEEYELDNYYCLILNNEKCIIGGENQIDEMTITPYYGFYFAEENIMDLANMNTGNYVAFSKY